MRKHIHFIKSKFWPTIAVIVALFVGAGVVFGSTLPNSWYQSRLAKSTHTNASGTATIASVAYKSNDASQSAYNKVKNAVVTVQNLQKSASLDDGADAFDSQNKNADTSSYQTASQGSGVVLNVRNGSADIITNYHVIEKSAEIQVVDANGDKATATILKSDPSQDLALIRVKSAAFKSVATLANSDKVTTGQSVLAIGSPLGAAYASTMTKGIVSQAKRTLTNSQTNYKQVTVIQTDASINQGNSGGALINEAGQVIGISSSKISASANNTNIEGMGFAIPSNQIAAFIK
ncbi:trypsin-like peptidase domain-containing protein [Fructobacillus sp. CRL 2054]|uniref:S1C family serine protease n=1 Tax=Fructobacillus sp. CRL 2054 TaxID=2763007 RepID=UPI0023781F10|nr:trypsin-like peptidase domain-containing protein [Fructobacillus sp. CRL 2054]MDD9138971.1 trypsin-like peptidase domain-containing protein [Fructobacillus sp. CRL 2054]